MITPLAVNAFTALTNTQKTTSNNHHGIAQKVGNAWQAKSVQSPEISNQPNSNLTEAEIAEVNQLLAQLKVNDTDGDTSIESHRENFLVIYQKLINAPKDKKIALITNIQKMLEVPNTYDNQELLSITFKRAIYRYNAISLMNQPLIEQMNDQIHSISLEGNDEEEEYKFY
uniref:Uncharacterized protein n=1 Tax=Providencia stuartii TaxID=588 RepID=A0AAI9DEW7_PROST|nr:hypothetical protein [Providencia stuartii]